MPSGVPSLVNGSIITGGGELKEIANDVFNAVKGAAVSLADVAPVKATAAGALAFATGSHGTALWAFIILILIDLFAKLLSLSSKRLVKMGLLSGLWQCVKGLYPAIKSGDISSEIMKTKFAGKVILYMILVTAAVHVDAMAGADDVFLKVVWYYLAGTEFISIAENLRDAGVESLDPLLNFIRSKLGGLK